MMDDDSPDVWIVITAGYQVGEWPVDKIAEALDLNLSVVRDNLQQVAEFIGLTLRSEEHDNPQVTVEEIRKAVADAKVPA